MDGWHLLASTRFPGGPINGEPINGWHLFAGGLLRQKVCQKVGGTFGWLVGDFARLAGLDACDWGRVEISVLGWCFSGDWPVCDDI